ncbi:serine hydroxymethyltransferase [Patescibacteria group bacterium]
MKHLRQQDSEIHELIKLEKKRQAQTLMMIPSENIASLAVQQAVGSCLANKYAEGYPGKRYYQGQEYIDKIENLVIKRAKRAFKVPFANVQALSGSPANLACYFACLNPGDKIMGLSLSHGGHLTHGAQVSATGKYYKSVSYVLGKSGVIDYNLIEKQVLKEKPKLIIAGITAYPKILDWQKFATISKKVNAYLLADISHLAGLVIAGVYPSPVPFADIITTTTHKTLRGPRGALIMVTKKGLKKDKELAKKINRAVFPGLQGGPHLNSIAGIGVALKEAKSPGFKKYAKQTVKNCKVLSQELKKHGFDLVAGGSNTHLILMDLRNLIIIGNLAAEALEKAGIIVNYNTVPFETNPPFYPSGLRLGTPGLTSRGMREREMVTIGKWINLVLKEVADVKIKLGVDYEKQKKKAIRMDIINKCKSILQVRNKILKLCKKFPVRLKY